MFVIVKNTSQKRLSTTKVMNISSLTLVFGRFIIHQPLIAVLCLFDTEITSHGVHGNKRLIKSLLQLLDCFSQFSILLNYHLWLHIGDSSWRSYRARHVTATQRAYCVGALRVVQSLDQRTGNG